MASETNDGKDGGLLKGKRHEDKNGNSLGGIKAIVTDTNQMVELEGGEVIINREASKKHWKELSRINQSAGGGVPILPPDNAVSDTEEYKKGGRTIEFNPNLLPNKWVYSYAKKIKEKYPKVWGLGGNEYGNEAFKNLERAYERGNWTENEEWMYVKWQSFNARHKKDFRIAGVIANLKWLNVVEKGWDYMKNLIEEEIKKRYQKGWKHKMETGGNTEKPRTSTFVFSKQGQYEIHTKKNFKKYGNKKGIITGYAVWDNKDESYIADTKTPQEAQSEIERFKSEMETGGEIKGSNNKTGEKFAVVIGSEIQSDEYVENGIELNVRKSYGSRISEVKIVFDVNRNLDRIIDYGYSLDGIPNKNYSKTINYSADKKKTIQILSDMFNPSFAKNLIQADAKKMAKGGGVKNSVTQKEYLEYLTDVSLEMDIANQNLIDYLKLKGLSNIGLLPTEIKNDLKYKELFTKFNVAKGKASSKINVKLSASADRMVRMNAIQEYKKILANEIAKQDKMAKGGGVGKFKVGDYFTTKSTGDTLFLIYSTKYIKVHWNDVLKPSTKGTYPLSTFLSMIRKGDVEIVKGVPKEVEFKTGDVFRTKGTGDEEWQILKVGDTEVEYKGLQSNQTMKLSRTRFESNFTDAMDWDLRWYRVENKKVEFKVGDWFYEVGFEDEPFVVVSDFGDEIGFGDFGGDSVKSTYKKAEAIKKIKDGLWKATTKPKTLFSVFEKDDLVISKFRKELGQVQKATKSNGATTYEIVLTDGTKYFDTTDFGWKIASDEDLKKLFLNRDLISDNTGNFTIVDLAQPLPKQYALISVMGSDFRFSGSDLFDLLSGLQVNEFFQQQTKYYLQKEDGGKTEEKPKDTNDFEFVQKTPTGEKSKLNYLQQILVRSKPFKDWFGDWETASKNYIANGKKDFDKDFKNVSKVMDMDTLEPRVVYHGTPRPEEFFVFETRATGLNRPYSYFAHNIEYSQNFHTENSKVLYHCFLNVRTPFRALGKGYEQRTENADYWEEKIIGTIAWDKYAEISKTNKGAISIKKVMSAMGNYLQALAGNNAPFWRIMSFDIIGLFKAFLEHYEYDGMFYSEEWTKGYDEKNPAEFTKAVCVFNPQQIKLADGRNLAFDGNNPDIRYKKGGEVEPPNDHINRKAKLGNLLFGKKYADGGNLEQHHLQDNRLVETSPPKKENESTTFVEDLINKMKNN